MKNKVLYLIIGVLVGAIIATLLFFIFSKNNSNNTNVQGDNYQKMMRDGNGIQKGMRPEMQDGENLGEMSEGEPPELPDSELPQIPEGENNNENGKFKQRQNKVQNTTNSEIESTESKT